MRMVQVFLKTGAGMAEVSAQLISYKVVNSGVWVTSKEDSKTLNFFPHQNLDFIRIWDEK